MSYTSLILKDSPVSVWSLSDTGSVVAGNGFLIGYDGSYGTHTKLPLPIVYGGGQCIRLDSDSAYGVRVPSLDKMSSKSKSYSSSIEFWLKVEDSISTEKKIMKKPDSNTGIYINGNYIIFKLGDTDYEQVMLSVKSFQNPMHIVASYRPGAISLSINGRTVSKKCNASSFLTKTYDEAEEFFDFYKTSAKTYIDSIAIYSTFLPSSVCKRHFIYGVGYSIPENVIKNKAGKFYQMTMEFTDQKLKYSLKSKNKMLNTFKYDKNIITTRDNKLSTAYQDYITLQTASDVDSSTMYNTSTDSIDFPVGSSIIIKDKNEIFENGFVVKINFTASSSSWVVGSKKLILKLSDEGTARSLNIYAIRTSTHWRLIYDVYKIDGTVSEDNLIFESESVFSLPMHFCVYEEDSVSKIIVNNNEDIYTISSTGLELPMVAPILEIGAEDIDQSLTTADYASDIESNRLSVGGFEMIYGLIKDDNGIVLPDINPGYDSYSYVNMAKPDKTSKRIKYFVSGEAYLYLGTDLFGFPVGTTRVDYGYPDSVNIDNVIISSKIGTGSYTQIYPGSPIPGLLGETASKTVTFKVNLKTSDAEYMPVLLDGFEINEYSYSSGTICKTKDNSSNINIKMIGSGKNVYLPEIYNTPTMYYGNTTGLRCSTDQYAEIQYSNQSIGSDNIQIGSIMFSCRNASSSATNIINIGSYQITQTGTSVTCSNATVYKNGSTTGTVVDKEWNHYVVVFNTPVAYTTTQLITIGSSSGTPAFNIDNLGVFNKSLSSAEALHLYNLLYSTQSYLVNNTNAEKDMIIKDTEDEFNNILYQLNGDQKTIYPTAIDLLASIDATSDMIDYSSNLDLGTIDGVFVDQTYKVLVPAEDKIFDGITDYSASCTVSGDTFTATGHSLVVGEKVYFTTTGVFDPIIKNIEYYVVAATSNTFKVSSTSGGSAISVTTQSGSHTVNQKDNTIIFKSPVTLDNGDNDTVIYVNYGDRNEDEFIRKVSAGTYSQEIVQEKIIATYHGPHDDTKSVTVS